MNKMSCDEYSDSDSELDLGDSADEDDSSDGESIVLDLSSVDQCDVDNEVEEEELSNTDEDISEESEDKERDIVSRKYHLFTIEEEEFEDENEDEDDDMLEDCPAWKLMSKSKLEDYYYLLSKTEIQN